MTMTTPSSGPGFTAERVERALDLLAQFIELDGDIYLPMYERLEAELEELKRRESVKDRVRKRAEAHKPSGGLNAI